MSKDCQFCGTNVSVPESGALILNRKHTSLEHKPSKLLLDYEDGETVVFQYHSIQDLVTSIDILFHQNPPHMWLHILNLETSQSFPISLQNLYERLKFPDMARIIHNGEFSSHLQPIIKMNDESILGFESLLRVDEKDVPPGMLFSYAHRSGLHSMLDQKARRSAVKAKAEHLDDGHKVFINFLPSTIYVPEFCLQHTFKIVNEFGVDPEDLVFEVVETEKITDVKHLKSILDTYKASGMKVALDDVGSGYSTLEMLTLLQPDYLKIDRAYVQDCHTNPEHQKFLFEVMERANLLNIKVLAEGIETADEYDWLKQLGVDYGQGYFIGKPSSAPMKEFVLP